MRRAVLIAGPTASGKSHAAMAVARAFGGAVVNADSMQVYRELNILSARPNAEDEAAVPHRLYGFVPAAEAYSTGKWMRDVTAALDELWDEGLLPVVTGGTGLYFQALLEGLSAIPDIPRDVRRRWKGRLGEEGTSALHALLAQQDPVLAARLAPGDTQRILRGLEVFEATGKPLSAWQEEETSGGVLDLDQVWAFVLQPPREVLYGRCDARFDAMISHGGLDEARRLSGLNLDADLPAMKALGVRQLIAHLRGECTLEEAVTAAKTWTRRYAKRQMTWFRRNMISWNWPFEKDSESMTAEIFAILRENELTGSG